MWGLTLSRRDEAERHRESLDVEADALDDADDAYDPMKFAEEGIGSHDVSDRADRGLARCICC